MRAADLKATRRPVVLLVTIDTECDKGSEWQTLRPLSFHNITHGVATVLTPLFQKYQVRPTYLISPEVLRDAESVKVLENLPNAELGTHLHGEFIMPEDEPLAAVTSRVQASYSPPVEFEKLKNLTQLFYKTFGRKPAGFRGGRFSLSRQTLGFLSDLEYEVDTTVTPFRTNSYQVGPTSNYWGAPIFPYRPRSGDPRKQGDLQILEVPVSIASTASFHWPRWLLRLLSDSASAKMKKLGVLRGSETLWIRPLRGSASQLTSWVDFLVRNWPIPGPAVINVMFHSNESWIGTSPYTMQANGLEAFKSGLELILDHTTKAWNAKPLTLCDLAAQFRK